MTTQNPKTDLSLEDVSTTSTSLEPTILDGEQEMLERSNTYQGNEQTKTQNKGVEVADSNFDLESIRLPQHFGEQIGVKKMLTTVPVRRPNKTQFFRTHPEHRMDVMLLKYGETDEQYIVKPEVVSEVLQLAKPYRLVLVVDRLGTAFIWPLAIPDEERPMDWHKSAMVTDSEAQKGWVRMASNQALGAYDTFQAAGELAKPVWPAESWPKLMEVAFKQNIIDSPDHIILQKLQGLM
jgi:hypothetical protein